MDIELFSALEKRIENLLDGYAALKRENLLLNEENRRLLEEREGFKTRIDAILKKLEGI
ncbi:MAG: hypothetical protein FD174_3227 [Geobacteraceae bacterium]|nr:MAG: hypothetical protein FD174_3227 [Geobacteraceae bacterium]